ncbi:MAG: T9SS type A sorting domain-containing protein, partial [Bacteroidales bacterium]|nr:T9SS type A sorting domain-containing protein [Bacteroidales bacterium]
NVPFVFEPYEWDQTFPNQGTFEINGLSKITAVDIWTEGIHKSQEELIRVSPNPAKDKISISGIDNYPVNVEILNVKGQVVLTFDNLSASEINLSGLSRGMYFIHIQNNDFDVTRKLVIR